MCSGWFIDHAAVRWWLLSCCSSDMSGASNTLAREFLTDVHQLCSAVAQRAEARDEDEEESHMVALGEYLVRGRGFLLLSTLDSIIDQVWEPILEKKNNPTPALNYASANSQQWVIWGQNSLSVTRGIKYISMTAHEVRHHKLIFLMFWHSIHLFSLLL